MKALRWVAHRSALELYRRLPLRLRRAVVRTVSPTFTAGSMALVERDDGTVLLIRQVYRRNWALPGGLLQKQESPAAAVVREIREEVGLDVEVCGRGTLVVDLPPRRFDFVFRARVVGPTAETLTPTSPEIAEVAWFPRDALPELQFESQTALRSLENPDELPYVAR